MLVEFVKDRKGHRIGTLVAVGSHGNYFSVGFALCRKKEKFCRERGIDIAHGRANNGTNGICPHSLKKAYLKMRDRAERYFHTEIQFNGMTKYGKQVKALKLPPVVSRIHNSSFDLVSDNRLD